MSEKLLIVQIVGDAQLVTIYGARDSYWDNNKLIQNSTQVISTDQKINTYIFEYN